MAYRPVLQFKITLQDVSPVVWRRIQISDLRHFWDLQVTIQNAMGWAESPWHEFTVHNPETGQLEPIGIPNHYHNDSYPVISGLHARLSYYLLVKENQQFSYRYDRAPGWLHRVEFEGEQEKRAGVYPLCLAGENACPPAGIKSVAEYEHFLIKMTQMEPITPKKWLHRANKPFDPTAFDPQAVRFDNPMKQWQRILSKTKGNLSAS